VTGESCTVAGCGGQARAKGLCNRHYKQARQPLRATNPCACGCGGRTEYTFLHGHHTRLFSRDEQARRGRQNTGQALRDTGEGKSYRKVAQRHEHRIVAEQKLGRPLVRGEIVHHKNGNKRDNHPDNLEVMTQSEHARLHARQRNA
jgi:hypothetical protein